MCGGTLAQRDVEDAAGVIDVRRELASPLHALGLERIDVNIAPLIPYFLERDMDELFRASAEHLLEGLAVELARNPGDTEGE